MAQRHGFTPDFTFQCRSSLMNFYSHRTKNGIHQGVFQIHWWKVSSWLQQTHSRPQMLSAALGQHRSHMGAPDAPMHLRSRFLICHSSPQAQAGLAFAIKWMVPTVPKTTAVVHMSSPGGTITISNTGLRRWERKAQTIWCLLTAERMHWCLEWISASVRSLEIALAPVLEDTEYR